MARITCHDRGYTWDVECVAVMATRSVGGGNAAVQFWAQSTDGTWIPFRKADNRSVRLPRHTEMTWLAPTASARGSRVVWNYQTAPVPLA